MTGMIIDGCFASSAVDSSGESLDIEGCDISTLSSDGLLNYEHVDGGTKEAKSYGQEIVGRIIFAKKIFSVSDCDTDREEFYWNKVKTPFIYGIGRLYDGAGHVGAQALAAQVRDHHANGEQILIRFSIEGSTLERDKDNSSKITSSVARKVAITTRPCNRTCDSGLVSDPNAPDGFDKAPESEKAVLRLAHIEKGEQHEHPLYSRLGGSIDVECDPLVDTQSKMFKALEAGSYSAAPGSLTGGAALQREDRGLKARAMAAVRDYGKKKFDKAEFRVFAKTYLPEADDSFLDHFTDVAHDYHMKKSEALGKKEGDAPKTKKAKAPTIVVKKPAANLEPSYPAADASLPVRGEGPRPPDALTIRGVPAAPPLHAKTTFDEGTGILHLPPQKGGWRKKADPKTKEKFQEWSPGHSGGQFPMYIPSRDKPEHKASFQHLMDADEHVNTFHDYAMDNWAKMNQHFKAGTLPPEAIMHAALFAQLSPNTPVPMQELMYGHLVDSMKHKGIDARHPGFDEAIRRDWMSRDKPNDLPQTSPEHWDRLGNQIRIGADSKEAKRAPGELMSFMLANNKFDNMAQYHQLHDKLVELVGRHKGDARAAASEMMMHKAKAGLHEAARDRATAKGKPDPGPYTAGPDVNGLAPKTTRYMLGMLGGNNVQVPDTHFSRYLFGLEKGKGKPIDNNTIDNIKEALWNKGNTHVLDGIDRYYAQHHDAVQHMFNHPKYKHLFKSPEDAVFPAFWKNWVSIVPHEQARGMTTGGDNEGTDHRVFWDNTIPMLGKSEGDLGLAARTASIHAKWVRDHGEIPALMLFYRHLAPKLMANAVARDIPSQVMKFEALTIDYKQLKKTMSETDGPTGDYQYQEHPVEFGGHNVIPGSAITAKGKYALLHEDETHFTAVPHDKVNDFDVEHLTRLPKAKQNTHFWVVSRPSVPVSDLKE